MVKKIKKVKRAQCEGCGLKHGSEYPYEPTVTFRPTLGRTTCNDCAAKFKPDLAHLLAGLVDEPDEKPKKRSKKP